MMSEAKLINISRNVKNAKSKAEALLDDRIYKILEKERKTEERMKEYKIKKSLQYFDIKRKYDSKSMIDGKTAGTTSRLS